MDKNQYSHYFLLVALGASCLLVYLIAQPFLGPLILAAVFAFLFQHIYQKLLGYFKGGESWAAFVTTLIAIVLILLPITLLGTQIFRESTQLYQSLLSGESTSFAGTRSVLSQIRTVLPIPAEFELDLAQYAGQALDALLSNLGAVFSSFAKTLLSVFVFLTAFYFFLKDGDKLKNYLVFMSPLEDKDDELIVAKLRLAVSAVVKGNLTIGLVQGMLTGVGFAIFGIPNPVLWGAVAAIAALIPGIGTALVITPAVIYLFVTGNTFGGVGLLVWGLTAVGLIDNFLGPKLVGRGMQLHPLAVFVAVLGGLAFFGPLGFLLGPLAMSVCLALISIYSSIGVDSRS